jgi:hypothetical protein
MSYLIFWIRKKTYHFQNYFKQKMPDTSQAFSFKKLNYLSLLKQLLYYLLTQEYQRQSPKYNFDHLFW